MQVELIGFCAGTLTTLCWLPQVAKILRERRTEGISLVTQTAFALGVFLWLVYGAVTWNWPLIVFNGISFVLASAILVLKLRLG